MAYPMMILGGFACFRTSTPIFSAVLDAAAQRVAVSQKAGIVPVAKPARLPLAAAAFNEARTFSALKKNNLHSRKCEKTHRSVHP
jgi:hypothetical protein